MSETEQPMTDGPQRINCPYCGQDGSVDRLRAENKIAVEALERIEKDYSGAMEIAADALARIHKMGGET